MNKATHLNVLHIASGDLWAGAEVQLYTLIKELLSLQDITTSVILLNHGKLEQELLNIGISVTVINEEKFNAIEILARLVTSLRQTKPDVIHTHRFKENILGSCAAFLSGNIPSLRTTHGAPEQTPSWNHLPKRIMLWFDWFLGRFLQQKIISVSSELTNLLGKNFPSKKITTIKNGIDLKTIRNNARQKNTNSTFRIGIAGRLVPIKRVDIFIKTARYILDHSPDRKISFHIYGDGPLRDDLIKLSQQQKTDDIVYFEGHSDDMVQALQKLDALLMTSDHEGLPMVLLEAMALQIPIIAHAVGGIPDLLDHGACGILVHKHDASGYGNEIHRLLTNPDTHTSIQQNAFTRVSTQYSAEKNACAYRKEYSLLAKHPNNA